MFLGLTSDFSMYINIMDMTEMYTHIFKANLVKITTITLQKFDLNSFIHSFIGNIVENTMFIKHNSSMDFKIRICRGINVLILFMC